jgi:thiosulfate dehydrogenase
MFDNKLVRRGWLFFLSGVFLGPFIIAVGLWLGIWPWRATSVPTSFEKTLGARSLHRALAREAKKLRAPFPASDETLLAGLKIFRANCAGCHGDLGQPSAWGANGFYPRVPQFGGEPSSLRAEEMFLVVRNGIRYSGMGAWKELMSEDDTWRVVIFLSNGKSLSPSVRAAWEAKR